MAEPIADLTGARAKLGRAKEHLVASDAEMQRLWEPHADKRFIQFSRDGEWHVVSVSPIFEFSPELSLIVGDFFNNLRAVLDHLVWQLVLREGKKPDERTQFPFFYSEEEFIKKVKSPPKKSEKYSPLHGIPVNGDAWAIIEKAQPWYNCKLYGFQPREDMLATVALLSNIDKHRTLLATQPFPDQTALSQTIVWNPSDAQPIEKRIALMPLSHEKSTELMRLRFPTNIKVSMYVNGRFPIGPTFGDEDVQRGGLKIIYERVSQIVGQVATLPRVNG